MNLFSPNDCKKNDKIIYKYYKDKYCKKKTQTLILGLNNRREKQDQDQNKIRGKC